MGRLDGRSIEARNADAGGWSLPRQRSLPELVEARVIDAIHRGELRPGDRIVELDLSSKLGVSRAVLREALRMLEAKYVISRKGRGTFVTPITTDQFIHVSILRATLEGTAARLVVERLTPKMAADLKQRIKRMDRAAVSGRVMEWRQLDWEFHETVCVMADNPYLLSAWQSISHLIKLYILNHPDHATAKSMVRSKHQALHDALTSGDPDLAELTFRRSLLGRVFEMFGRSVPKSIASLLATPD